MNDIEITLQTLRDHDLLEMADVIENITYTCGCSSCKEYRNKMLSSIKCPVCNGRKFDGICCTTCGCRLKYKT